MDGFSQFAIELPANAVATVFMGVKTVPQGCKWTLERFGRYRKTLRPGLDLIVPYFDRIGRNATPSIISLHKNMSKR